MSAFAGKDVRGVWEVAGERLNAHLGEDLGGLCLEHCDMALL
jgi:hypothetical protein